MTFIPLTFIFYISILIIENNVQAECPPSAPVEHHKQEPPPLSEEEQINRCCIQATSCEDQKPKIVKTKFEVKAMLEKCEREDPCETKDNKKIVMKCDNISPTGAPKHLHHCKKKLILKIKVQNRGITYTKNQYIIIDHVFDPKTRISQRLLIPYIIKIAQDPVLQTYPLNFKQVVNSNPREDVINKNAAGYTGCNLSEDNPTCGSIRYNDEIVPFSTGFCCPCDEVDPTNCSNVGVDMRLPIKTKVLSDDTDPQMPIPLEPQPPPKPGVIHNNTGDECDQCNTFLAHHNSFNEDDNSNVEGFDDVTSDETAGGIRMINVKKHKDKKNQARAAAGNRRKRRIHKRGGQDCADRYTPPHVNPVAYHSSTHCMRFSDLWYSVYSIREPCVEHSLKLQIYEKLYNRSCQSFITDLTNNLPIVVGMRRRSSSSEENNILVQYTYFPGLVGNFAFKSCKVLLIPEPLTSGCASQYPELYGGPDEYLVLDSDQVQPAGSKCNVAGVGFEAFVNQENKCLKEKSSCLKNQPKQFWEHDKKLDQKGEKGCYFLKFYGCLPDDPIKGHCQSRNKTVSLYYQECHISILDLEIRADDNYILRASTFVTITEVYIDATYMRKTIITVKVTNSGLVAGIHYVSLSDFPLDVPAGFNTIITKPALIPPQLQHVFTMEIECELHVSTICGKVQVLNMDHEILAVRQVLVRKSDRCICIWHCKCGCNNHDGRMKCKPLTLDQYHAAGFQGGLPVPIEVIRNTFLDDMISITLYLFMMLFLLLLFMGLIKAVIGICVVSVGLWGLDLILDLPKPLNKYYEQDIQHRAVVYDEEGWPLHPDTGEKVRNTLLVTEFCVNIVFFIIYPFALMFHILKKLCCSPWRNEDDSRDSFESVEKEETPENESRSPSRSSSKSVSKPKKVDEMPRSKSRS